MSLSSFAVRFAAMALALLFLLVPWSPARADTGVPAGWDVTTATEAITIGRVELRYDPRLKADAEMLAENIPAWWSRIEQDLAGDLDDTMLISYVPHSGRIAEATGMPRWAAGVAHPPSGEILIAAHAPDGSKTDLEDLLKHEMVHVALYRATGGQPLPRWFHEGVAESFADTISFARMQTLAATVFGGGVPALEDIERSFHQGDPHGASVAYAASRDFVSYMRFRDPEGGAMRQALRNIRSGVGFEAAFIHAYDLTIDELSQEWRAGLRGRFSWFPIVGSGELPFFLVTPLVVVAFFRKRRKMKLAWARLEREEQEELARFLHIASPVRPGHHHGHVVNALRPLTLN